MSFPAWRTGRAPAIQHGGPAAQVSSVADHYANLLAPVYTWTAGGSIAALAQGEADLAGIDPGTLAVDLGAGFGMHAIPLARAGWRVVAVDSAALLLGELAALANGLPIAAYCGDILHFPDYLAGSESPELILCMGDTLTHLPDEHAVVRLARLVAAYLAPQGRFIATFRDYSQLPAGTARFIPVRADAGRILTCFLEAGEEHVLVHDLLHERGSAGWELKVSAYRKLRLDPAQVRRLFQAAGLTVTLEPGPRGMVKLVATRRGTNPVGVVS